jgi:hypothetical protein
MLQTPKVKGKAVPVPYPSNMPRKRTIGVEARPHALPTRSPDGGEWPAPHPGKDPPAPTRKEAGRASEPVQGPVLNKAPRYKDVSTA